MRKTIAIAALAGLTITSSLIASTGQADAQLRRWGPIVGLGVAAGVTGAIIADSMRHERCGWMEQYDRRGNYLGRSWVCTTYPY